MFSSVQLLSRVRLFATPWIAARQASLSITNSQSSPRLTSIESVMPSSQSHPLSSPSPPAPNPSQHQSFPMSQHFAWGGQSTGVSALASVLPKKSQGWSPSEWTGWISLQSKGLSRVFSTTSSKALILRCSALFTVQLSNPKASSKTLRIVFDQIPGHPVAQSIWHIKLAIIITITYDISWRDFG